MSDELTAAAFLIAGALIIGALVGVAAFALWMADRTGKR